MRHPAHSLSLCCLVLLAGCATHPKPKPYKSAFVREKARVVEVDNTLGTVVLQVNDKKLNGFWVTSFDTAPMADAVAPPRAEDVRDTVSHRVEFPAKPGDDILFSGLPVDNEIWIRWIYPLPRSK